MEYVRRIKALKILDVSYKTLYNLVKTGELETITVGKTKRYNVFKYLKKQNKILNIKRQKICYCRVSSNKQKEDLKRQINFMKVNFPTYKIISDIGSGLNYKRKGLHEIINSAIKGEIEEIVITYKDRLLRFGFELVENLIKIYSNGKITIINKRKNQTETEIMTKDIISIMNVYVAKINGLRKIKK